MLIIEAEQMESVTLSSLQRLRGRRLQPLVERSGSQQAPTMSTSHGDCSSPPLETN